MAEAKQTNQPIAQIPPFEQHENHHRQYQPCGPGGADDRTKPREAREIRDRLRPHDNGPRGPSSGRRARLSKIGLDNLNRVLKLLDRSSLACSADVRDLRKDIDAIGGQVVGQMIHLARETPTGKAENDEHERGRREDSRDAA